MRFHITYRYLATGMEGHADAKDYGIVEAATPEDARERIVMQEYPEDILYGPTRTWSSRGFLRGCLSAKEISGLHIPMTSEMIKDGAGPIMTVCTQGHVVVCRDDGPRLPCGCPASSVEGRKEEGLSPAGLLSREGE